MTNISQSVFEKKRQSLPNLSRVNSVFITDTKQIMKNDLSVA